MKLTGFDTLWKFYPMWSVQWAIKEVFLDSEKTPLETKTWVVEKVRNACVIKLCYALNCSSNPIRPVKNGAEYLTGRNGCFLIKVTHMRMYLKSRYGNPNYETLLKGEQGKDFMKGKQGLICFVIEGWPDATGHFDLWDGSKVKYREFFNHPGLQKILLWEVSR